MHVVGIGEIMSMATDATPRLWQSLMPRRQEISGRVSTSYISMRVHLQAGMPVSEMLAPDTEFEKWAAVEVADLSRIPEGMRSHTLEGGLYAVFVHRGSSSRFEETMQYIFGTWLPGSEYELDCREQFESVPENWRPDDGHASEEIYIPIKKAT